MSAQNDGNEGIRDKVQSKGEKAAADLAQALVGSPAFGQAVSAAVSARDRAADAQRAAMGAMGVSSSDDADRLERRVRVLSDRLEETEDRLDAALEQIRELRNQIQDLKPAKKR